MCHVHQSSRMLPRSAGPCRVSLSRTKFGTKVSVTGFFGDGPKFWTVQHSDPGTGGVSPVGKKAQVGEGPPATTGGPTALPLQGHFPRAALGTSKANSRAAQGLLAAPWEPLDCRVGHHPGVLLQQWGLRRSGLYQGCWGGAEGTPWGQQTDCGGTCPYAAKSHRCSPPCDQQETTNPNKTNPLHPPEPQDHSFCFPGLLRGSCLTGSASSRTA